MSRDPYRIWILSGLPGVLTGAMEEGILRIAQEKGLARVQVINLRDHTDDRHRTIDDAPYGGGPGMILMVEPVIRALRALPEADGNREVFLLSPRGETLVQKRVEELSKLDELVLICGRYKGVDERIRTYITGELSLGDYVLSGGELAAAVIADAIVRLLPDVLGCYDSALGDSFTSGLLDSSYYTRPEVFDGLSVPPVLLSGHHGKVEKWRRMDSLQRTLIHRPDLLEGSELTPEDQAHLRKLGWEPIERCDT
ncbi:MAG: tRNA (guanosine(37)-N1)-methyltransferase TrmD [Candidatus Eisenbacteria bacterium]|uniref:tRNA (guanine-N(1)-)-methyltransferase n=1 Tax=Eiseniibacteriota bacterium TaxID=2212470 RepID=A0A948RUY4_UNCEI|nr:tRNA (guanosine(37)-N1)-methyltransferase TrmD [Candidatus Eisenbacteria bacterium]MBU1950109.1 tRNA (guanosine(37)-N1)-methyltransferase TrmD [Candidatus Eisenbacteria bacterium]MBU2691335.1 tRNA (guanosine(37)-N1)-methyltransferase TrmD [Candidatus Eisenbacteria bacterium]